MRILIYEFVTGGGWFSVEPNSPAGSLLAEGHAMLTALAGDFMAIDGCEVEILHDVRLAPPSLPSVTSHDVASAAVERALLAELSSQADWTVLIAPEFDGHLLERVELVEAAGGRLLSPGSQVVALASDKHATAEHLTARDVRGPYGIALEAGDPLPASFVYPAVLKPRDGAGSLGVRLVNAAEEVSIDAPSRLEMFCSGTAASVACLCGPREIVPLEPCFQHLAGHGDFTYQGGSLPIDSPLARRARALAVRAVSTLPQPHGYLGVDLVLGDDPAGDQDYVIEINPRLTTSYAGLRALSRVNLAGLMIAVAEGRAAELCWNASRVHFSSSGVSHVSPTGETVS
jgi:predicted ATP-grasp superfamily ATP-dependent carboligase